MPVKPLVGKAAACLAVSIFGLEMKMWKEKKGWRQTMRLIQIRDELKQALVKLYRNSISGIKKKNLMAFLTTVSIEILLL